MDATVLLLEVLVNQFVECYYHYCCLAAAVFCSHNKNEMTNCHYRPL